jgi:hypothetical protein
MIRSRHRRLAYVPRWTGHVLLPPAAFATAIALRSNDPLVLRSAFFVLLLVVFAALVVFTSSMRRAYRLLAIERAELATSYGELAAQRSLEHTAMLEKFAMLLRDQADEIEGLRGRGSDGEALPGVAVLFGENADTVDGTDEVAELWPDLAEAPTVVDLMAWDAAAFRRADQRREDVRREA